MAQFSLNAVERQEILLALKHKPHKPDVFAEIERYGQQCADRITRPHRSSEVKKSLKTLERDLTKLHTRLAKLLQFDDSLSYALARLHGGDEGMPGETLGMISASILTVKSALLDLPSDKGGPNPDWNVLTLIRRAAATYARLTGRSPKVRWRQDTGSYHGDFLDVLVTLDRAVARVMGRRAHSRSFLADQFRRDVVAFKRETSSGQNLTTESIGYALFGPHWNLRYQNLLNAEGVFDDQKDQAKIRRGRPRC
jgi:hypothetical protein